MPLPDGVRAGAAQQGPRRGRAGAAQGHGTGASGRNRAGHGAEVGLRAGFAAPDPALLTDPQSSGGLLVSCAPAALAEPLAVFHRHGFGAAPPR